MNLFVDGLFSDALLFIERVVCIKWENVFFFGWQFTS